MGEEENDYATKQSSLLMRRSDHLSSFKLCNEINVTSTSTFEFDCSHYFCSVDFKYHFEKENFCLTLYRGSDGNSLKPCKKRNSWEKLG